MWLLLPARPQRLMHSVASACQYVGIRDLSRACVCGAIVSTLNTEKRKCLRKRRIKRGFAFRRPSAPPSHSPCSQTSGAKRNPLGGRPRFVSCEVFFLMRYSQISTEALHFLCVFIAFFPRGSFYDHSPLPARGFPPLPPRHCARALLIVTYAALSRRLQSAALPHRIPAESRASARCLCVFSGTGDDTASLQLQPRAVQLLLQGYLFGLSSTQRLFPRVSAARTL